jgi:hypothetical protein
MHSLTTHLTERSLAAEEQDLSDKSRSRGISHLLSCLWLVHLSVDAHRASWASATHSIDDDKDDGTCHRRWAGNAYVISLAGSCWPGSLQAAVTRGDHPTCAAAKHVCVGEGGEAAHSSAAVGSCVRHPDSATNCAYWRPTTFGAQATERSIKESLGRLGLSRLSERVGGGSQRITVGGANISIHHALGVQDPFGMPDCVSADRHVDTKPSRVVAAVHVNPHRRVGHDKGGTFCSAPCGAQRPLRRRRTSRQ